MPRLTDSPSPVPLTSGFVVKNGSKIRSRCSGAMPGPVSAKAIRTPPFAVSVRTVSEPPFGMPMAGLIDHKSILIQPMFWKGHVMGGFTVLWSRDRHRFSSDEMRLAEGIALQGALAVENSRLFEGVKEQMAELKRTQAQLVQSTKLAAIGELAANIAHEINNPLTTVLGFASFLSERMAPP